MKRQNLHDRHSSRGMNKARLTRGAIGLHRETLRRLSKDSLELAVGGAVPSRGDKACSGHPTCF